MKSYSDSYKAAGVDVTAGYKSVELMKEHVSVQAFRAWFPASAVSAVFSSRI